MSEDIRIKSKIDPIWGVAVPLAEALKLDLPKKKCFVYRLSIPSVGTHTYIGFTTQNPEERLAQHMVSARKGSKQNVHIKLREFGLLHEFEVLSEHPNEVLGLVAEIAAIARHNPDLNESEGGEGFVYKIIRNENTFGEKVLCVINKKKFSLANEADDHLRTILNKVITRYRKEIYNKFSYLFKNDNEGYFSDEYIALTNFHPSFDPFASSQKELVSDGLGFSRNHSLDFRVEQNLKYRRQIYEKVLMFRNFIQRIEKYQSGDKQLTNYVNDYVSHKKDRLLEEAQAIEEAHNWLTKYNVQRRKQKYPEPDYYFFFGYTFESVFDAKHFLEKLWREMKNDKIEPLHIVASYYNGFMGLKRKFIAIAPSGIFQDYKKWEGLP
ncbi:hypothetical protein N9M50_00335 [Alphaproteobacteria bacterium]|nr:hypothetical protein [Alphaproteobacteria bacterium]